ncbi:MAG: 5-oxoprolinase subunit PxpB [Anaerolineae bacterium]
MVREPTAFTAFPRVLPVGDAAFTVEFGDRVDVELNRRVHALDAHLQTHPPEGLVETVPTYRSLLVIYNPELVPPTEMRTTLLSLSGKELAAGAEATGRFVEIPVHYGGEMGPDLKDVAEHCDLDPTEVIRRHTKPTYLVAMLGFAPGFTYLLGLPDELATPRLETPRMRVPPGSVGIAGNQTGIYALGTPGGWRIIGRTPLKLFDPERDDPFEVKAGDRVRFVNAGDVSSAHADHLVG